jgi:WD40 repeat protein
MSRALPRYTKESVFTAPVQVTCISFSNDGRLLAAGFSNIARIWSVDEGRVLHNLIVDDNIEAVLWGPGNILYCGIASGYLIVKVMDEVNKVCAVIHSNENYR